MLSFSIHVSKFYMPLCFPTFIKARLTREDCGSVRLTPYLACSTSFFSRNSVFLSQHFSQNSVFSQDSASRTGPVKLGDILILEYLVGARIPWLATTMGSGCGRGAHESSSPESSPVAAAAWRHKSNVRMQQSRVPALPLLRCCRKD